MLAYPGRPLTVPHSEYHRRLALAPTRGLRDWRTQMDPADAARFAAVAGDALRELGYGAGAMPTSARASASVSQRAQVRTPAAKARALPALGLHVDLPDQEVRVQLGHGAVAGDLE